MTNDARLAVKSKTIKKLFAYSGNQCAFKDCRELLVDDGGTMIGKIAHIRSPVQRGPRFDPSWSSDKCRDPKNLMVLCGKHHDIVDDCDRVHEFPVALLEEYKRSHEARFKKAENALIDRYADVTANKEPTYPKTLAGIARILGVKEMIDCQDDLEGVRLFADQLAGLPHDARGFAYKLTKRMRRLGKAELLVTDTLRAFKISQDELRDMMAILASHQIGEAEQNFDNQWVVTIANRWPHNIGMPSRCNPFEEIIEFCEASHTDPTCFLEDLNFALYDVEPH
jgi:hypothetical protein